MKKIIIPFFIFTLVVVGFVVMNQKSSRGPSSTSNDPGNGPVSAETGLEDNQVKKQIKKRLLKSLDWHHSISKDAKEIRLYIRLENLKIKTVSDEIVNFCSLYPVVNLTLEAPNTSYSGEHPEVIVSLNCNNSDDFANFHFSLDFLNDQLAMRNLQTPSNTMSATIRVQNWENDMQNKWRVKRLLFFPVSKEPKLNIDLTSYEILAVLGHSIEFKINPNAP